MFLWTDYNIIDSVFREQGGSINCAGIDVLNFLFAWAEIDPVRPNMPRITHHRSTAYQVNRRVMSRRVENRCGGRRYLPNAFCERYAVAIKFLIFTLTSQQGKDVERSGERKQH